MTATAAAIPAASLGSVQERREKIPPLEMAFAAAALVAASRMAAFASPDPAGLTATPSDAVIDADSAVMPFDLK